jgi:YHS domain-containing protein
MVLRRDDWLDLARKVDWIPRYVDERELFPEEISGRPWLTHDTWRNWNEAYRTTYREYVANQRAKDAAVLGVRAALSKPHLFDDLDPGWVELVKFHNGAVALAEYAGAVAELRMARFGRDSAWRTMASLGALDEIRHTQIPLLIGHDLLAHDGNFDWTHKAFHTNQWLIPGGEANTLAYGLPALCNLCQLPALFIRPGRNTACTIEMGGRRYLFCSEPCRWIFEQESSRFADHNSVVDRIVAGEAPGKLTDLHRWMGLQAPVETGKDLRRGLDPWRLDPVPTA